MNRLRVLAQLIRLPALPTALADIGLGAFATAALPGHALPFVFLLLSSACLYTAGMVWNDFFDVEVDRRERPGRPIPSGRVSRRAAGGLGAALLGAGLLWALAADLARGSDGRHWLSAEMALALIAAILLYDGWLKRTVLGPVSMGACRFLNVLLGMSVTGTVAGQLGLHLALVVGIYVVGVTWLARTEAGTSTRGAVGGAAAVVLAALILALPVPLHHEPQPGLWPFIPLLVTLGFLVGLPIRRALDRPGPELVQAAVKRCLYCLILLDAVLATGLAGVAGLALLVLLVPVLYLNRRRWLYAT